MILRVSSSNQTFPISKRSFFTTPTARKRIFQYPKLVSNEVLQHPNQELSDEDELLNSLKQKLVYNSYVSWRNNRVRWRIRYENLKENYRQRTFPVIPLSLKYMYNESQLNLEEFREVFFPASEETTNGWIVEENQENSDSVNLPYNITSKVEFLPNLVESEESTDPKPVSNFVFGKGIYRII